ncbi:MAG TPA: glycosyltransferase family 39 protein [Caulobacteraceae bacterium]|jgi:4-amino-4-deoxy-L-arabinose transferase-like glycosyltransferase|nr:glycosyltransferase family 39 protein [Caulobacteraceae bacterium]
MRLSARWLDGLTLAGFILVAFVLFIWRSDALPLQYWDESRIANNALEAAMAGHWLVPTDHGWVDRWETKPPLLPWAMAAFMKAGFAPLWAVRAPSIVAALATLGLVWGALRIDLKDRLAGAVAVALVLSANVFVGLHGARTGDYEVPESALILAYVLCLWKAADDPARPGWLFAAGGCIVAAAMIKGVAGLIPLPGCAVFMLADRRRFAALAGDWRTWLAGAATIGLIAGYYLSREAYDPGYLKAVFANELGSRLLAVNEGHGEGPFFYLGVLFRGFLPGLLLLPLAAVSVFHGEARRRDLALISLAGGGCLILVLSIAQTKLFHYVIPAIPLLAVAAAIGVADAARRLAAHPARARIVLGGVAVLCAAGLARTILLSLTFYSPMPFRMRDGAFLAALHKAGERAPVTVVDDELWLLPYGGPPGRRYSQIIDFYATLYRADWPIGQAQIGWRLATPSSAITCSPAALAWLRGAYDFSLARRGDGCVLLRLRAPRNSASPTPSSSPNGGPVRSS